MGRTQRKRKRKNGKTFCACNSSKEIISLHKWLKEQGVQYNDKLAMAVFDDTGRGVLAKRRISPGEELMNLPLNATINITTILMDLDFCRIFLENKKQCFVEYKNSMSFQSLMAFYLVYLLTLESSSKWHLYLESLPKQYSVPYFLPKDVRCNVDPDILSVICKQETIIDSSFIIFDEILKNTTVSLICDLKNRFNMCSYEWAYFTVNTRCVFMDLSNLIDVNDSFNSVLELISDNTKISLCPYLDMINHSPYARNETKLLVSRNIENININNIYKDLFSDVMFSIYTKNNFDPYTQVFICYGDSHNLKLITEYGFYLPNNDLDYVPFSFEEVITFINTNVNKLSKEQLSFIQSHGLNKDLYIDLKGFSYNFYALLMVVKYYYNHDINVSRLIYSAAICSSDSSLNELVLPLIKMKLSNIRDSVNKLHLYENKCVSLDNCIALMCQYVKILEKFIY